MSYAPEIEDMCEELERAGELMEDELGEYWVALGRGGAFKYGSEEFHAAWEKEVRAEYARFKKEWRVVEYKTVMPIRQQVVRHISELDDWDE